MKANAPPKFMIGQIVYLKTDPEQLERIITQIAMRPGDYLYSLVCGVEESFHYDFEFSEEKDILKATS